MNLIIRKKINRGKDELELYPATVRDADILMRGLHRFMVPARLMFNNELVGEVSCDMERGWNFWRNGYFMRRVE